MPHGYNIIVEPVDPKKNSHTHTLNEIPKILKKRIYYAFYCSDLTLICRRQCLGQKYGFLSWHLPLRLIFSFNYQLLLGSFRPSMSNAYSSDLTISPITDALSMQDRIETLLLLAHFGCLHLMILFSLFV